jgi:hypothetical protein
VNGEFDEIFRKWAERTRSVHALLLIGSRAQLTRGVCSADQMSDWDFHVVTSRPRMFLNAAWMHWTQLSSPIAYTVRSGRMGYVTKISIISRDGEFDLVLLPSRQLRLLRWLYSLRLSSYSPRPRVALADLATVLRSGYRVLKGSRHWSRFFKDIVLHVPPSRLQDEEICNIANGCICDIISVRKKIDRGEYLAAQRLLHREVAEANFRLLHELKLRSAEVTYPDARRIEFVIFDRWRDAVTVAAHCDRQSLNHALARSAQTCRELVEALVGSKWEWPHLPRHLC